MVGLLGGGVPLSCDPLFACFHVCAVITEWHMCLRRPSVGCPDPLLLPSLPLVSLSAGLTNLCFLFCFLFVWGGLAQFYTFVFIYLCY